ncbi:MAG: ribosomal-protein-alanine acetyltransferase [Dehalococcoidia bacterium]|nr:MAG: ribosomal-protein-alanine acetyltransferase [Dehalococcoidia bacterium]
MPLRIDPLRLDDIPQITAIERESFPTPWPPSAYARELDNALARYFVLRHVNEGQEERGDIVGVAGLWIFQDEAHLMTIAVRRCARGLGYGERLLLHAIETAIAAGADLFTLEVRQSNEVAQRLYRKYGLEVEGRRKNYYTDVPEDAYIMTVSGLQDEAYRQRIFALREALERRLDRQPAGSGRCP